MENKNGGRDGSRQENSQVQNRKNNSRNAPLGFEGMNYEQRRGAYGANRSVNNRRDNVNDRSNSGSRQD